MADHEAEQEDRLHENEAKDAEAENETYEAEYEEVNDTDGMLQVQETVEVLQQNLKKPLQKDVMKKNLPVWRNRSMVRLRLWLPYVKRVPKSML